MPGFVLTRVRLKQILKINPEKLCRQQSECRC